MLPEPTRRPLDDIRALIAAQPGPDKAAAAALRERRLASPPGELGAFEDSLVWLAEWQAKDRPSVARPQLVVFAGNHGLGPATRGEAARLVAMLGSGATTLNRLCQGNGVGLKAFDLALEAPTADIALAVAMGEAECAATMAFGMEAAAGNADLLALAGIGDGAAVAAAALGQALFGDALRLRVDDGAPAAVMKTVADAVALHARAAGDPLDLARRLGGRETAAIIGAIIAARVARVPVLIDGLAATAAAAVLHAVDPRAIDHCRFTQTANSRTHHALLAEIGASRILDTAPTGIGVGAVLAIAALKAMVAGV